MKVIKTIIGVVAILIGIVWFFQGINVISGSTMSGESRFVIAGLIALVGGIIILADTWRNKAAPDNEPPTEDN